jgi:hypothetical protein
MPREPVTAGDISCCALVRLRSCCLNSHVWGTGVCYTVAIYCVIQVAVECRYLRYPVIFSELSGWKKAWKSQCSNTRSDSNTPGTIVCMHVQGVCGACITRSPSGAPAQSQSLRIGVVWVRQLTTTKTCPMHKYHHEFWQWDTT